MSQRDPFSLDSLNYEGPTPCHGTMQQVQAFAEKVGEVLDVRRGDHIDRAVDELHGTVHYLPFGSDIDGTIYVHGRQDFDVVLPINTSVLRDRFTIAHELGHYFLHSRQGEYQICARRDLQGLVEYEANWFAAALLMPEARFRQVLSRTADEQEIATIFGVSPAAANVRKQVIEARNG